MRKFSYGDHVMIDVDLGAGMRHFASGCEAIVLYSYHEQYGCGNTDSLSLYVKGRGKSSWYRTHQLTLIEANRLDLLDAWIKEAATEAALHSDIAWMFANGRAVLNSPSHESIARLAQDLDIHNLCGSRGEGITYYNNAKGTLAAATPFLEKNDYQGWCEFCKSLTQ